MASLLADGQFSVTETAKYFCSFSSDDVVGAFMLARSAFFGISNFALLWRRVYAAHDLPLCESEMHSGNY